MPKVSSIDSVEIFYEVIGEGDISLIFIGGWGAPTGRECWKYQLSLAEKYKIVLVDLAGHGQSGKNRETYTMKLFGHDINSVVEELDLSNIILIGWSMGGPVILEAACMFEDRVLGLIPVDSLFPTIGSSYTKREEETILLTLKPFEDNFTETYTNLFTSFLSDKFDPEDVAYFNSIVQTLDKRSMISAFRELLIWNVHDILHKIKKPIKSILAGRTMEHFSKEEYEKYINSIVLEGLGHIMHYEDPETFNTALEETMRELSRK